MKYATVYCQGIIFSAVPLWAICTFHGPGVYVFSRQERDGSHTALYIGEAMSIAGRARPSHEHWREAVALGMDEVCVHLLARTQSERLGVEGYLRQCCPTPLNQQRPSHQAVGLFNELMR